MPRVRAIKKTIFYILSMLLFVIPFYKMVVVGVYSWHVKQPEVVLGAIEVLAYFFIAFVFGRYVRGNYSVVLCLIVIVIFLSTNGVILAVSFDYLYCEVILYIGFVVCDLFNIKKDRIYSGIIGISVCGALYIFLSLAKMGTINITRWALLLLLISCLVIRSFQDNYDKYKLIIYDVYDYLVGLKGNGSAFFWFLLYLFVVLTLFAKTNNSIEYDSLWYGLRPEYVLLGEKSFYDYLGFESFVFYYPKLMELIFLPISGLGDYSFIISMNVYVYSFLAYVSYRFIKEKSTQKELNESFIWLVLVFLLSIPAITGISSTAKPDILGCTFVIVGFYLYLRYKETGDDNDLGIAVISLILCSGTKLTYLLWGGITFIYIIVDLIISKRKVRIKDFIKKNICGSFGLVLCFGVHLRTYILTGYPFYPICINLFNFLGFHSKNGLKNSSNALTDVDKINLFSLIRRLYQFIFDPSELGKVIMLWTSNVLLVIILMCIVSKRKIIINATIIYILIMFLGMIYFMVNISQPDGNYFICPIIVQSLFLLTYINYFDEYKLYGLIPLVVVELVIMFISHPSWGYGTHIPKLELVTDNFETEENNEMLYMDYGIQRIAEYINDNLEYSRIICSDMDYGLVGRIPCRIETFHETAEEHFSLGLGNNYESFIKMLDKDDIKGIIVFYSDESKLKDYMERYVKEIGISTVIQDEKAILYCLY